MTARLARPMVLALLGLLVAGAPAIAVDDGPLPTPATAPRTSPIPSAEQRYNDGLARARARDWTGAEAAYREALRIRPAFAEAWNGLGYALRQQGKYEDSLRAYQEALRLHPAYPEALEYLGEAYVQMGRVDDARRVLERLRPLSASHAEDLAKAIAQGPARPTAR